MSNSIGVNELTVKLEEAYSIGRVEAIESVACDEEELLNQNVDSSLLSNFRVMTSEGQFFLKRVGSWVDDRQLACIEHFLRWTCSRDLPLSPALVCTSSDESHIRFGDSRYQLFEFLEQEKRQIWMHSDLTREDCKLAGQLLGRFRKISSDYLEWLKNACSDREAPSVNSWKPSVISNTKSGWNQLLERANNNSQPALQRLSELRKPLTETLEDALKLVLSASPAGDMSLVHGDFHPGNILFNTGPSRAKSAWLVDYDLMHSEESTYDLGYALVMFAYRPGVTGNETGSGGAPAYIDQSMALSFLEGAFFSSPADVLIDRHQPESLICYMTISCFLIIDWAEERMRNGLPIFSEIYARIINDMVDLLIGKDFEQTKLIYLQVMKEIHS
ncbi:MAG TPA: phosphotransferase [Candidatus Melainabacteria bacterium]|nr:phosphotransferase [Candidatus Melainabacteria bacterium]